MTKDEREAFDRFWPFLKKAVSHAGNTHCKRHVIERIEDGRAQFWPLANAAIVTEIVTYDAGVKHIRGWLAGGDMGEIIAALPAIESWGKRQGCSRAIIHGRKGWQRALSDYAHSAVILTKDL
jgi:hypothetical protein